MPAFVVRRGDWERTREVLARQKLVRVRVLDGGQNLDRRNTTLPFRYSSCDLALRHLERDAFDRVPSERG